MHVLPPAWGRPEGTPTGAGAGGAERGVPFPSERRSVSGPQRHHSAVAEEGGDSEEEDAQVMKEVLMKSGEQAEPKPRRRAPRQKEDDRMETD